MTLAKELSQDSGRVLPREARADLVLTQAYLTRLTVPDEDSDRTLLLWLAKRGFHDVLALRAEQGFEVGSGAPRSSRQRGSLGALDRRSARLLQASA